MKKKYIKDYIPKEDSSYEYTGKYYLYGGTKEERQASAKIQLIYSGISLLLLLLSLSIPGKGGSTLYVVLPMELMMVCYVYHLIGSLGLFRVEGPMEQRFYDRIFERPMQVLTVALILEFFVISGQALGVILPKAAVPWDWYMEGLLLLHFIISFPIWNKQRKEMKKITEVSNTFGKGENF